MSQSKDDTTEHIEPSGEEQERPKPGSYYYDDSTGYEIYDPEKDAEEDEDEKRAGASPSSSP
jgi:hypothetical protein